jgi:hypothetical protein
MGIASGGGVRMNPGVWGMVPWQTPRPVVPRPLPGLIPVTPRCSHRRAGRLHAPPRSPLPVGINQQWLAPCWMSRRSRLGLLKRGRWWVSVSLGAQHRWHRDTLKGLVTTCRTPRDVDAGPPLHLLRHALRLRWRRWLHLPQCLPAEGQGVGFTAVRQHAVMSNPHEARRHHMEQLCGESNYVAREL